MRRAKREGPGGPSNRSEGNEGRNNRNYEGSGSSSNGSSRGFNWNPNAKPYFPTPQQFTNDSAFTDPDAASNFYEGPCEGTSKKNPNHRTNPEGRHRGGYNSSKKHYSSPNYGGTREPREPREQREPREPREQRESREPREPREPRETTTQSWRNHTPHPVQERSNFRPRENPTQDRDRSNRNFYKEDQTSWTFERSKGAKEEEKDKGPDTSYYNSQYQNYNNWGNGSSLGGRGNYDYSNQRSGNDRFGNENSAKPPIKENRERRKLPLVNPKDVKERHYESQREALSDQLEKSLYDCIVCFDKIRRSNKVWSCSMCFNVFHLSCIQKWATSSNDEQGWRCPSCQTYNEVIPIDYFCFCGKMKDPPFYSGNDVPHSCGLSCGHRRNRGAHCAHPCIALCHPGPCPPCDSQIKRNCPCGKMSAMVLCSSKAIILCEDICDKPLNCTVHNCTHKCHEKDCEPCDSKVILKCHCKKGKKEEVCRLEIILNPEYSCGKLCGGKLTCRNHVCPDLCHEGKCKPCKTSVDAVLSCPCGQTGVKEACEKAGLPLRNSCLDPIPVCGKECKKFLPCGPIDFPHTCKGLCHLDPKCTPCALSTERNCRCGNQEFNIPCQQLNTSQDLLCNKKCTKKKSCGRHKCNTKCCIDFEHICTIVCDKDLRCGIHKCERLCHNGHCPPCGNQSFEELRCECGHAVIYPPVPCGTSPPQCDQICTRDHECTHPVHHNCHSDPECPPCTVLTEKWCYGHHELRKNIMCFIKELSCGLPCNKTLSCTRHKCSKICHAGGCLEDGVSCSLPCSIPRSNCGHPCAAPCHMDSCPQTKCRTVTDVYCKCKRKKDSMVCWKKEMEFETILYQALKQEIALLKKEAINSGDTSAEINEEETKSHLYSRMDRSLILDCDKECSRVERNRKLADALKLENPDATTILGPPNYSDFMKSMAQKNPQFSEMVHDKLTALVMKINSESDRTKVKNRTYSFEPMNRDKRHFVHEYCEHFGVQSEAFDEEPNRNILATASKNKSWLPSMSLIDVVFRQKSNPIGNEKEKESGKSLIYGPNNRKIKSSPTISGMVALKTVAPGSSNSDKTEDDNDGWQLVR